MRHLWLVEKVWFRAKIDLKKDLSRWKRRYTTLAKFYAPGSWSPGSVNVDNFNFSRPYVVTANKHVDFHTRVVKKIFECFAKFDWGIWTSPFACRTEVWTTEFPKFKCLGREFWNFELIGPLQFAATTVLWRLVIKSLKYSLSLKKGWERSFSRVMNCESKCDLSYCLEPPWIDLGYCHEPWLFDNNN